MLKTDTGVSDLALSVIVLKFESHLSVSAHDLLPFFLILNERTPGSFASVFLKKLDW